MRVTPLEFSHTPAPAADKPHMADLTIPLQGMSLAESRLNTTASRIARLGVSSPDPQGDTVDLSAGMVALMQSSNDFQANVKVAHTFDEMNQSLLDIMA
jgi:hypothetical protein